MRPADAGGDGGTGALFTPPTGSPGAIRAAAGQLRRSADPVAALTPALRSAHADLTGNAWDGSAAAGFAGFAGRLDSASGRSATPLTTIATAAEAYADALQTAQHTIRDAKRRYDSATARADSIREHTNADPDRTQEQVDAAQRQVDAAEAEAQAAVDDAQRAWQAYDSAVQTAVSDIDGARGDAEAGGEDASWLKKLVEHTEPYRDYNDRFHAVWDGLGLGSWISHAAKAVTSGLPEAASALAALRAERDEWDALVKSVKLLQEQGEVLPSILADADRAASDLSRTEGLLDALEGGVRSARWMQGLEGLGRVIDGSGILADALTILDPPDEGVMGNVDRGVAGVNGALLAANLAMDEIPVAGEVVMVGTGVYLAGDYFYHHWGAFHDACDWVGHTTADLATGAWHGVEDAASGAADVASDAWDGAKDLGGDIVSGIGSLF